MTLSATDSTDRVEQLIALTERLTELIALEAQAFEQHRPQDAAAQIEEVSKLANIYRHESTRVRANPDLIATAPLAQRTRLTRATEAFDAVLARQSRDDQKGGPGYRHHLESARLKRAIGFKRLFESIPSS